MGACCSKENDIDYPGNAERRQSRAEEDGFPDIRVDSAIREDELIVEILRREFKETPEVFLLNNLLMTVQFFENTRRDRDISVTSTNKMEKDLNVTLPKNENMECICPDTTFEIVNNNLRFRPLHGPKKHRSEPFLTRRLFVLSDIIEIVTSLEVAQYTSIDKPAYQVRLEESRRKGFVRLKQVLNNKAADIYPLDPNEAGPSGLQTPSESDDFYMYTSITDLRTPKPLEAIQNPERRDTLPNTCFATRKIRKPDHEIQELQIGDPEFEISEDDLFDTVVYIDAKGFMNYFKNALFPNSLGRSLGFTQHEINLSQSIPGKIFCNLTDDEDHPVPCEVIPSVAIEWPSEQTFEFIMREDRPTIKDNKTGIRYKWPTDQMIKEMRTFKCVVVPKGYWKKKGEYSDASIEWEIAFPKAERYLEARMSDSQIKCLMFLLAIHRTFIEPKTEQHGLLVEHIRCHMYWECEANYKDWPEHRLGAKIIKIIENIIQRLSKSELPDYFIKQNNHFRNIPKKYLQYAQKIFHEILQNPVVYFIKALRCIRYSRGNFHTPFEFKEFYRMLTQVQGYKLVNPNLKTFHIKRQIYTDPETQWKHLQDLAKRKQILEERNRQSVNLDDEFDKVSVDSIDVEWTCEKQFEIFKIKALLTYFIKSFIALAKDIFRLGGSENQTLIYLKQASYLNRILEFTSPSFIPEVQEFKGQIHIEQERVQRSAVLRMSDVPPATPVRNSLQFDYSINQQLKSTNVVNWNSLHNSFTGGVKAVKVTLKSPVLKNKSEKNAPGHKKINIVGNPRKSVSFVSPK